MVVYYSTFALICALLMFYKKVDTKRLFYFFITAILVCVAGLRYNVGTDYVQYAKNYAEYRDEPISLFLQPTIRIVARVSELIYDDSATWFFLMSMITVIPVMVVISKYSIDVGFSVVMYVLLCCWHFPFNIIKQGAAIAIIFMGYGAVRDRKFWQWLLVCLIAATFHVSAVIMIPVYFLVDSKINWQKTLLIISVSVTILFAYSFLFQLIATLKQGTSLVSLYSATRNGSVNILRILVNCAPIILCFMFGKYSNRGNKDFVCLYYMSLLNAAFNIATMNSIYLNRFCCYTNIFNVLFIPMLFKTFKKQNRYLLLPLTMILYFLFWSYDLYKGSTTVNYSWIFTR